MPKEQLNEWVQTIMAHTPSEWGWAAECAACTFHSKSYDLQKICRRCDLLQGAVPCLLLDSNPEDGELCSNVHRHVANPNEPFTLPADLFELELPSPSPPPTYYEPHLDVCGIDSSLYGILNNNNNNNCITSNNNNYQSQDLGHFSSVYGFPSALSPEPETIPSFKSSPMFGEPSPSASPGAASQFAQPSSQFEQQPSITVTQQQQYFHVDTADAAPSSMYVQSPCCQVDTHQVTSYPHSLFHPTADESSSSSLMMMFDPAPSETPSHFPDTASSSQELAATASAEQVPSPSSPPPKGLEAPPSGMDHHKEDAHRIHKDRPSAVIKKQMRIARLLNDEGRLRPVRESSSFTRHSWLTTSPSDSDFESSDDELSTRPLLSGKSLPPDFKVDTSDLLQLNFVRRCPEETPPCSASEPLSVNVPVPQVIDQITAETVPANQTIDPSTFEVPKSCHELGPSVQALLAEFEDFESSPEAVQHDLVSSPEAVQEDLEQIQSPVQQNQSGEDSSAPCTPPLSAFIEHKEISSVQLLKKHPSQDHFQTPSLLKGLTAHSDRVNNPFLDSLKMSAAEILTADDLPSVDFLIQNAQVSAQEIANFINVSSPSAHALPQITIEVVEVDDDEEMTPGPNDELALKIIEDITSHILKEFGDGFNFHCTEDKFTHKADKRTVVDAKSVAKSRRSKAFPYTPKSEIPSNENQSEKIKESKNQERKGEKNLAITSNLFVNEKEKLKKHRNKSLSKKATSKIDSRNYSSNSISPIEPSKNLQENPIIYEDSVDSMPDIQAENSSDEMNGRVSAMRVADGPGVEVQKKKHAGIESSNTYDDTKTTATIRRSRPSSIRPPKRNTDKPIVKEILSSSESERVIATPRILTTFDMFGEKLPVSKPKIQEKPPISTENHDFNAQASTKKFEAANNKNTAMDSKGLECTATDKKKYQDRAKSLCKNEKKHKKYRASSRKISPKPASTLRIPVENSCIANSPASPDKPLTSPALPGGQNSEQEKNLDQRCLKQVPLKCSVVMEKVDLSQYHLQEESTSAERKRKLPIKSAQNKGKKSKRSSLVPQPETSPFEADMALLAEVLNDSHSSNEDVLSVEVDSCSNVSVSETVQCVLVASSGEESFTGFSPDVQSPSKSDSAQLSTKVEAQVPKGPKMRGLKTKKRGKVSLGPCNEVRHLLQSSRLGLKSSEFEDLLANTKRPVRRCRSNSKSRQLAALEIDSDDPQTEPESDKSSPDYELPAKKKKRKGTKNATPLVSLSADDVEARDVNLHRKSTRSSRRSHFASADESQRSPIADLDMIDQKLDEVSRTATDEAESCTVEVPGTLEFDMDYEDSRCNPLNSFIAGEHQAIEIACNVQVESSNQALSGSEKDQNGVSEASSPNSIEPVQENTDSIQVECLNPDLDSSIQKFLALKQFDAEPSAYMYNPESRLIKLMDRAALSGFTYGNNKTVIILTEDDLQGKDVYVIDELVALLDKALESNSVASLDDVSAPEIIPVSETLETSGNQSPAKESPSSEATPTCDSADVNLLESGVPESQCSSQVNETDASIEIVSTKTPETPDCSNQSPCDDNTVMTCNDPPEIGESKKELPSSPMVTEVPKLVESDQMDEKLTPVLLNPELELCETKSTEFIPNAESGIGVAPVKDSQDIATKGLPVKEESSGKSKIEIAPDDPTLASTPLLTEVSSTVPAAPPIKICCVPGADKVKCLDNYHTPKQSDQEISPSNKHRIDSSFKFSDSCSSDLDEADSGDDVSSSSEESDKEPFAHKQGKKKKRKSGDNLSEILSNYVKVLEQQLKKSTMRQKQLKRDKLAFKKQMIVKDEALGRYEGLVDAIVEKVMANPELSAILEISSVPDASAILEQSKCRVASKQAV